VNVHYNFPGKKETVEITTGENNAQAFIFGCRKNGIVVYVPMFVKFDGIDMFLSGDIELKPEIQQNKSFESCHCGSAFVVD